MTRLTFVWGMVLILLAFAVTPVTTFAGATAYADMEVIGGLTGIAIEWDWVESEAESYVEDDFDDDNVDAYEEDWFTNTEVTLGGGNAGATTGQLCLWLWADVAPPLGGYAYAAAYASQQATFYAAEAGELTLSVNFDSIGSAVTEYLGDWAAAGVYGEMGLYNYDSGEGDDFSGDGIMIEAQDGTSESWDVVDTFEFTVYFEEGDFGEMWLYAELGAEAESSDFVAETPVAAIPAPGALALGSVGAMLIGSLRRRRLM